MALAFFLCPLLKKQVDISKLCWGLLLILQPAPPQQTNRLHCDLGPSFPASPTPQQIIKQWPSSNIVGFTNLYFGKCTGRSLIHIDQYMIFLFRMIYEQCLAVYLKLSEMLCVWIRPPAWLSSSSPLRKREFGVMIASASEKVEYKRSLVSFVVGGEKHKQYTIVCILGSICVKWAVPIVLLCKKKHTQDGMLFSSSYLTYAYEP